MRFIALLLMVVGLTLVPVRGTAQTSVDSDADGLPDDWETLYGLSPTSASDEDGGAGDPDGDSSSNADEWTGGTHPRGYYSQLFAEGAVGPVFDTRLAVANPARDRSVQLLVRFLPVGGAPVSLPLLLPPQARRTIDARDVPGIPAEFAIEVSGDAPFVAERTMHWRRDAHAESGATAARRTWFFAEGATHSGFELFYLLANPGQVEAQVSVDFYFADGPPLTRTYVLAPGTRHTIWANREHPRLARAEVATRFDASAPIIVERSMYTTTASGAFLAGHGGAGAAAPAATWYFAEGATGPVFDTFLLLSNPNTAAATVDIRFLRPAGAPVVRRVTIPAQQRHTVWVDHVDPVLADTALSIEVQAEPGRPVVAERAMWWTANGQAYGAGHLSGGTTNPAAAWAFAEGESDRARGVSTYLLIGNTGAEGTWATLTLLPEVGGAHEHVLWLPAASRTTLDLGDTFPAVDGERFGLLLEASAPDARLIAARSQYGLVGADLTWGTTTSGRTPWPVIQVPERVSLPRGGAPVALTDLVRPGSELSAQSLAPGVVEARVQGGALLLTPHPGAVGEVTILLTATAPDGRHEERRLTVRVGASVRRSYTADLSASGQYELPGLGAQIGTPDQVIIANDGTDVVRDIEVFRADRDFSSVDAMVARVTAGLGTDDARARALWQLVRTSHVVWPSATITTALHDPVLFFNGYGFGYCDDVSAVLALLLERAGIATRMWDLAGMSHTVVEAYYDDQWHMFDPSLGSLFLRRDNRTVASLDDVAADPWLAIRAGWLLAYTLPFWADPHRHSYPGLLLAREGHRMGFTLHPGETIALTAAGTRESFGDSTVGKGEDANPLLGRAELATRPTLTTPTALERWRDVSGLVATAQGVSRAPGASEGSAVLTVTLPWPVLGARLQAELDLDAGDEDVTIDVSSSGDGVSLDWSDLNLGRFRVPGLHVADEHVTTYAARMDGPAVHNALPNTPGRLEYRLSGAASPDARVLLTGQFFRASADDLVSVQVSADGISWRTVWTMTAVGGAQDVIDLSPELVQCRPCGLRLVFQSATGPGRAGVDALGLSGLAPFAWQPVWQSRASLGSGLTLVDVPLDERVGSFNGSMVFSYHVRVTMRGPASSRAALSVLALDTTAQVAPLSLPFPDEVARTVRVRGQWASPSALSITHRWFVDTERQRPPAPVTAGPEPSAPVDASAPFFLSWDATPARAGDTLISYHVEVCEDEACRFPISSVFDYRGTFSSPGADGQFGTWDDGLPIPIVPHHYVDLHDWLRPGARYQWRVRVQDATGAWSPFSPLSTFEVAAP